MSNSSRNPPWDRDETLLALDLYLKCNGRVPEKTDAQVMNLSNRLRSNPINAGFADRDNFRTPSAVVLKLNNIRQAAEGKGMPNNSKLDRGIWAEFGNAPNAVASLAETIAAAMDAVAAADTNLEQDEIVFNEGRALTRLHSYRERDIGLRRKVLSKRRKNGGLSCELCGASFHHLDRSLEEKAFEVHHLVPLASSGERIVRLSEVALLCASCHRLIHGLIAAQKKWVSISQARLELSRQQSA